MSLNETQSKLKEACTFCGSKEVKYLNTSEENKRNLYRCIECRKFFFVKLKGV